MYPQAHRTSAGSGGAQAPGPADEPARGGRRGRLRGGHGLSTRWRRTSSGHAGSRTVATSSLAADGNHLSLEAAAAVLENLHANCFVADMGLNLVYANRRARETLATLAPAVSAAFGVDLRQVVGGSIHRFHQDPARIERLLAEPGALPRSAVFTFGGVTLRTMISAVCDLAGQRIGYSVVWDDITERNSGADAVYTAVEAAAAQIDQLCAQISESADRNAVTAQAVASATDQLLSSTREIAASQAAVSTQVRQAVTATHDGVERMHDLQAAGAEIGQFLQLITNVAEQTKMLALNATIEAARAGESGRGFAVVADEVKQLAQATAASIGDIEHRVHAIQNAATAGTETLTAIEAMIEAIDEAQGSAAAAMEQQSAVTSEISASITGMARDAADTAAASSRVQQVTDSVREPTQQLHQMIQRG